MLGRMVRWQLVALVIVTVLGVGYASVKYIQLPRLMGIGTYTVTLEMPKAAGLYENALVSYRGIQVGRVDALEPSDSGVRAVLGIDDDVPIPADSAVSVRSTSAVGEQYVNFEPRSQSTPLADGQVIPADQVTLPTPTGELLSSVNQLAATVPLDKLNSTVDEAYKAFNGTGEPLARFIRASSRLQDVAGANIDQTTKLFRDLVPVLATQRQLGPQIRSFTGDLAAATDTLRAVDPSIRGSIDKSRPLADEADALLTQLRPTLPNLLTDMSATAQVLRVYEPAMRHVLVSVPAAFAVLTSTTAKGIQDEGRSPPSVAQMGFKLTFNNPPPCVKGFQTDRVPPSDLSNSHPPARNAYCKEPKDSPIMVRGFRNAPCPPGSPAGPGSTGARAAFCGWNFQRPDEAKRATDVAIEHMLAVAARNPKTRKENEAFIGDDRFSGPKPGQPPPAINGPGNSSNQDEGASNRPQGSTSPIGSSPRTGAAPPLPQTGRPSGGQSSLEHYLLAPLRAGS